MKQVNEDEDLVTIEPDGTWRVKNESATPSLAQRGDGIASATGSSPVVNIDDDEDDIITVPKALNQPQGLP